MGIEKPELTNKGGEEDYYKIPQDERSKELTDYEVIKEITPDLRIRIKYSADYAPGTDAKGRKNFNLENIIESVELLDKDGNTTEVLMDAWRYE